jgi:RNA polymerase sigma-70 factor, ECF subfamily
LAVTAIAARVVALAVVFAVTGGATGVGCFVSHGVDLLLWLQTDEELKPYTTGENSEMANEAAIQKLVEGHRQFLAFVERQVESRAVAEDILQSAFVKGIQQSGDVRDDERVVAWFYRILRNAIVDHYRRRAAAGRVQEALGREMASQMSAPVEQEVCACLMPLLATLKPEYREALELVDISEASLNDLAAKAKITPGNAAVRIHRAREAFRKQVRSACGACAEHGCMNCQCKAGPPDPATTAESR